MKITVCELPDEAARRNVAWADLVRHLRASPTDIVVLPEMPFCDWKTFTTRTVDPAAWRAALASHDTMMTRLAELQTQMVLASRPVQAQGKRLNQAFCWTRDGAYQGARAKYYLPDEPDGWEATWFTEAAWEIGRRGAQLIAAPRATGGHRRWPMAASLAAIMSGCFVASANRRSYDTEAFAGRSWLVSPEGEILGETSADAPFLTAEVDLVTADRAKQTYPRNLRVP